jgi:hypothetical protein
LCHQETTANGPEIELLVSRHSKFENFSIFSFVGLFFFVSLSDDIFVFVGVVFCIRRRYDFLFACDYYQINLYNQKLSSFKFTVLYDWPTDFSLQNYANATVALR